MTNIHEAVQNSDSKLVLQLLDKGEDINKKTENRQLTPLHLACSLGNTKMAKLLIEHGAEVNSKNKHNRTPLHYACQANAVASLIQLLLDSGADINSRDNKDDTPLHFACFNKLNEESMKALLSCKPSLNITNKKNYTPLDCAIKKIAQKEVIEMLKLAGAKTKNVANSDFQSLFNEITQAMKKKQLLVTYIDTINNFKEQIVDSLVENEGFTNNLVHHSLLRKSYEDCQAICHWFYDWYQSGTSKLQIFTIKYFPILVWKFLYFYTHSSIPQAKQKQQITEGDLQKLASIQAFLLSVFYSEIESKEKRVFHPVSLEIPSVFHKPFAQKVQKLTESSLQKHDFQEQQRKLVYIENIPMIKSFSTLNSALFAKVLLSKFNQYHSEMPINSLQNYCAICARIATIGSEKAFDIDQETVTKQIHQISQEKWVEYMLYYPEYHEKEKKIKIENEIKFYLSNELFQEMLSGIMLCFSRSQDLINSAKLSLSLIHYRAVYDLIPEVLLTTNSMMKISENI